MTHYLITGGAGFIGSHLSDLLLSQGHHVHVIDDLSTGSISNLKKAKEQPKFTYTIDTIFNEPLLAELIDSADVIFHLAAAVGVFQIVNHPIRTIETNIRGTELIFKHAAKKNKIVLVTSTSEVYGKATKIPFNEEDDSLLGASSKARWSYACSKLIDEFLAVAYWKERKLPVVVVRLFNTVGPRQTGRYGMVVPRFIHQASTGGPITVYGDGKQSRCFGYVGAVVAALAKLVHEPKAYGQVFNIGNDQEITILELAEMIRSKAVGAESSVDIKFVSYDKAYDEGFEDMRRRVPDLTKIKSMIDYQSSLSIEQIVEQIINERKGCGG